MKPHKHLEHTENVWLALEIGNSRLHWALFLGKTIYSAWDTDHLPESVIQQLAEYQTLDDLLEKIFPPSQQGESLTNTLPLCPLLVASVVPSITLDQLRLKGVYPTLGIDRALALWGAGKMWGFPMLVIDAGTALTFTAADDNECLVGGAILPGLGLQFATLGQHTGQLPLVEMQNFASLPARFALNTTEAIQSGVIYTILAGMKDFIEAWLQLFPNGRIAIKGGDRTLLLNYLQALYPEIAAHLIVEPNLIFWGMREIVKLL